MTKHLCSVPVQHSGSITLFEFDGYRHVPRHSGIAQEMYECCAFVHLLRPAGGMRHSSMLMAMAGLLA